MAFDERLRAIVSEVSAPRGLRQLRVQQLQLLARFVLDLAYKVFIVRAIRMLLSVGSRGPAKYLVVG